MRVGGNGLWDEDGWILLRSAPAAEPHRQPLRVRSLVGVIPLLAVEVLDRAAIAKLPGFQKRMKWFLTNRPELAHHVARLRLGDQTERRLLAIASADQLRRVLRYVFDEAEMLSPFGVRSLSRYYADQPYTLQLADQTYTLQYEPAESQTWLFGGNSNWRGPVWFPLNYLLIEALERYHHFYGDSLLVELPTGSGKMLTLQQVAQQLALRLSAIFTPDEEGRRPCFGDNFRYATDPHWKDNLLFHEYFHGDLGCGLGASHQTGWTALITRCLGMVGKITPE